MEDGPLRPQQCNSEALSWSKSLLHTRHWPLAPAGIRKARPRGRAGSNRYRRLDFHRQTPPVAANATSAVIPPGLRHEGSEVPRFFSPRGLRATRDAVEESLVEFAAPPHPHVRQHSFVGDSTGSPARRFRLLGLIMLCTSDMLGYLFAIYPRSCSAAILAA